MCLGVTGVISNTRYARQSVSGVPRNGRCGKQCQVFMTADLVLRAFVCVHALRKADHV